MNIAVLLYRGAKTHVEACLAWVDPFAGKVLHALPVPRSPTFGIFPASDCALISYTEHPEGGPPREVLDVYRLSDWGLRARLPMDCRAHFNVCQHWPPFLPGPDAGLIYVYKTRTLGHHLAEDFVCGLRLPAPAFTPWTYKLPDCVAGWSMAAGRAHAQMLFVAEGLTVGRLPTRDLDQKVAFWLGPEEGMGPAVSLGPRPLSHSDLGHARALLFAPKRALTVVVCNNGVVHLIDAADFRYLERQVVAFEPDHAMPIFAAQVEAQGRLLYVGTATDEARHQGLAERVVVHDLDRGRRQLEWVLPEPFAHLALTSDGRYLCGAGLASGKLWVLDARSARVEAEMALDGAPRYLIPCV